MAQKTPAAWNTVRQSRNFWHVVTPDGSEISVAKVIGRPATVDAVKAIETAKSIYTKRIHKQEN